MPFGSRRLMTTGPSLPSGQKAGELKRRAERNAGAFLGPDLGGGGPIPVPMRTLSDDYADVPEPEDSDRVPEPREPGRVRRLLDKLGRRSDHR